MEDEDLREGEVNATLVVKNASLIIKNTTTLEFMKIELERVLLQDPRLQDFKLELDYDEKGVKVDLTINVDGTDMELNFITDGIIIEETE